MRVEFLLVLLFKAENNLNRARALGYLASVCDNDRRSVLKNVRSNILACNGIFGNALLIKTHLQESQLEFVQIERSSREKGRAVFAY